MTVTEPRVFRPVNELSKIAPKLREYIAEVPLYRSAQGALASASDRDLIAAIPAVKKTDIKTNFPANFLRAGQDLEELVAAGKVEVEHTSGTTETRADLLLGFGWWLRQEAWALRLNSHIARVLDANPEAHRVSLSSPACNGEISYTGTPSAQRRTLGNTRFLSLSRFPFLLGTEDLDRMVEETLAWDPVFLDTDPVYAVVFALHCERRKVRFPKLAFILTSYEYTSVLHKQILKRVFGVPVYNLYGSTETGHLIMEDENGDMVPSPDIAHLEVIKPDARHVGELVVYTLTNDYMPLLNYQIGDLMERVPAKPEDPNGKVTYVLHGRSADTVATGPGRKATVRDIDQCFAGVQGVAHYRLHEASRRRFTLSYILDPNQPLTAIDQALAKLNALLDPAEPIEARAVKFLLPEGSGKFVLSYPYIGI